MRSKDQQFVNQPAVSVPHLPRVCATFSNDKAGFKSVRNQWPNRVVRNLVDSMFRTAMFSASGRIF